jgi:hypothetical protein
VSLFTFSVGYTISSSFFKLAVEGKAIFTFNKAWTTTGLLNESEINCMLIKRNRGRDEMCDGTDVCVSVPVWLAGLTIRIKSLVDSRGQ